MPMANLPTKGADRGPSNPRGWDGCDSRVAMQLQQERAGVTIKVDPTGIKDVLDR